tara:strand:- start:146 stop:409 length:264 start_codon:yes stop_codon:yes gene_type:complete
MAMTKRYDHAKEKRYGEAIEALDDITYLSGRGEEKIYAVPIDLRITDGCPASGDPWCLSKCSGAGAQLWNMVPITARVSKGGIKGCR